jgi:hypothetical protein
MAAHPVPAYVVPRQREIEPLPEVGILHRLLVRRTPAIALPVVDPLRDPLADILRIRMQIDAAWTFQRLQR